MNTRCTSKHRAHTLSPYKQYLDEHCEGLLEVTAKGSQPAGADGPVHDAMIAAEGDGEGTVSDGPDGEDARLRRIDDCAEACNAVHSQIGDGKGSTLFSPTTAGYTLKWQHLSDMIQKKVD